MVHLLPPNTRPPTLPSGPAFPWTAPDCSHLQAFVHVPPLPRGLFHPVHASCIPLPTAERGLPQETLSTQRAAPPSSASPPSPTRKCFPSRWHLLLTWGHVVKVWRCSLFSQISEVETWIPASLLWAGWPGKLFNLSVLWFLTFKMG